MYRKSHLNSATIIYKTFLLMMHPHRVAMTIISSSKFGIFDCLSIYNRTIRYCGVFHLSFLNLERSAMNVPPTLFFYGIIIVNPFMIQLVLTKLTHNSWFKKCHLTQLKCPLLDTRNLTIFRQKNRGKNVFLIIFLCLSPSSTLLNLKLPKKIKKIKKNHLC